MIRTLLTLHPGTKQDGTRCLKGELSRALTTTDDHGTERTYPQGTRLTLVKNHASGTYSQLAMLDDRAEAVADLQREIDSITDAERARMVPF